MYSLTQATQLFLEHAQIGSKNASPSVLSYNSHKIRHSIGVLETGRNLLTKIKETKNISLELQNRAEIVFFLHDL
jgi:predicted transcriptional regulator